MASKGYPVGPSVDAWDVVNTLRARHDPCPSGIRQEIEALSVILTKGWEYLEAAQYDKVIESLTKSTSRQDKLPGLCTHLSELFYQTVLQAGTKGRINPLLRLIPAYLTRLSCPHDRVEALAAMIYDWASGKTGSTAAATPCWEARGCLGSLVQALDACDKLIAQQYRDRLRKDVPRWAEEYNVKLNGADLGTATRGMFEALTTVKWGNDQAENKQLGLDMALSNAVAKLCQTIDCEWFMGMASEFTPKVAQLRLQGKINEKRIWDITDKIGHVCAQLHREKRAVHADAFMRLEEAIHRPHRMYADNHPGIDPALVFQNASRGNAEVEIPLNDLNNTDGCAAALWGTSDIKLLEDPATTIRIVRADGRIHEARPHEGVFHEKHRGDIHFAPRLTGSIRWRSGTDLKTIPIRETSVIRCTRDNDDSGKYWLGFHFTPSSEDASGVLKRLVCGIA